LSSRSERFWDLQLKLTVFCVFCSAAPQKFRNLSTKATQIGCNLSSLAAKSFGICQQKQLKLIVFCSAAQRPILEFGNQLEATPIDCRLSSCAAPPTKATQIDCILFGSTAENFGIKKLKFIFF
jgi:hypothetical protein